MYINKLSSTFFSKKEDIPNTLAANPIMFFVTVLRVLKPVSNDGKSPGVFDRRGVRVGKRLPVVDIPLH